MSYHNELVVRVGGCNAQKAICIIEDLQIDLAKHDVWAVEWHDDFENVGDENEVWIVGDIEIYFASDSDGALQEMIRTALAYDCTCEYRIDTY